MNVFERGKLYASCPAGSYRPEYPPRYDGPRERQVRSSAGLIRQGVDVTLFASGDSMTAGALAAYARLRGTQTFPRSTSLGEPAHRASQRAGC